MAVLVSSSTIVNSGNLGGNQTDVQTARLSNGGYVVAWSTSIGGQTDVMFQRYDAAGNKLGGAVVANTTTAGDQKLTDIVATADGRFTLAWASGDQAVTRSFSSVGTATSTEINNSTLAGAAVTGVQLIATSNNSYRLVASANNAADTAIFAAEISTAGAYVNGNTPTTINAAAVAGSSQITQLVEGDSAGEHFALLSGGATERVFSTSNTQSADLGNDVRDFLKLQDGFYVAATDNAASSGVGLVSFTGSGNNAATYTIGQQDLAEIIPGNSGSGADVFDKLLLDLGGGRILYVFVGDPGVVTGAFEAIYAGVYNLNTGLYEGDASEIYRIPSTGALSLADITLGAAILTDGRVGVSWSVSTGLAGLDVFTAIIDPRSQGVTRTGTSGNDFFAGTQFDDVFNGLAGADRFEGNAGTDRVSYASAAAGITIDLANSALNTGEAANDVLSSIEDLTGSNFADNLYGTASANTLAGGLGNDLLFGREGDDNLSGGENDDLASGGLGADILTGGNGNDRLNGGFGNDFINGGLGTDRATGSDGNDTILGGDGNDVLFGQLGDDHLEGGAQNDFLSGGAGNDTLIGGDDNDTINGGDGDDEIEGGAGDDVISAGAGFNNVNGGLGTDTITYANLLLTGAFSGVYADLDPAADPVGNIDGFSPEDDLLSNIENITGSTGSDYLGGSSGVNVLRGGQGDDTFFSRGGNDVLFGGAGGDGFLFANTLGGTDSVRDFTVGVDKIQIVSDGFGGINAGNIATSLVIAAAPAPSGTQPQFLFDNAGAGAGSLIFDSNGTTAGGQTTIATIIFTSASGLGSFGAGDFLFL